MSDKSTITSRGQITIPKSVRDRFGLRPGMRVQFVASRKGVLIRKQAAASTAGFRKLYGILRDGIATDTYLDKIRGPIK